MEEVLIFREKWDSDLNYYLPCGESPEWKSRPDKDRYCFTLGEYLHNSTHNRHNLYYKVMPFTKYIDIDEVDRVEKYLYVVNAYEPMYFFLNDKIGLKFIDPKIVKDMKTGKCKLVFVQDTEGYSGIADLVTANDFRILQRWLDDLEIPGNNVYCINANLKSKERAVEQGCKANILPITVQETWNDIHNFPSEIVEFNPVDDQYLYLNYCRRPRPHRVFIGASLIKEGIFDRGKNSFNALEPWNEQVMKDLDPDIMPFVEKLYSKSPLLIDKDNSGDDITLHVPLKDYSSTFINIVGETLYSNDTLFISEKTWKPLIVGSPFVLVSSPGALEWLRAQGFKTFGKWIDESYDLEYNHAKRFNKIINIIKFFSTMSIKELIEVREEMYEVCAHNKQVMLQRTKDRFYTQQGEFIYQKPTVDTLRQIYLS